MKQKERKFVSVRSDRRADNGKDYFTVTWTPEPNDRRRKVFSGKFAEAEANAEADSIEAAMQRAHLSVAKIPQARLAIINAICEQLPDDNGLTLLTMLQSHLKRSSNGQCPMLQEAGQAYIDSRSSEENFSLRHRQTVKSHMGRLIRSFGARPLNAIGNAEIQQHIDGIGKAGKTRFQHLTTIRAFFRWSRDIKKWLPFGVPTAADEVEAPKVQTEEHEVYTPEQFIRLLVFTTTDLVQFYTLGQLAGIRAAERLRLTWDHWRNGEDNKLALTSDIAKGNRRRRGSRRRLVDVMPSLALWLTAFQGEPEEFMVPCRQPHKFTSETAKRAEVPSKKNALRAGYASYHLELFDNAALTAKNDGHTVPELETTYKSITGVTKKTAREMFGITPQVVLDYARDHNLPEPEWAHKFFEQIPELHPPISVEEADRVAQVGMAQKRGLTAPQPWDTVEPETNQKYGQHAVS